MAIASINPATGEHLATFEPLSQAEIEVRIQASSAAFHVWKKVPFADRTKLMEKAADLLEARAEQLGRLATVEMGKTLRSAIDEVHKSARGCRYYASHAEGFLKEETIPTEASRSFIRYEPLGSILAIMPWNFPFWQVFRFAAPAIMAGNVVLLKHAPNVPQCAESIADVFTAAGFPAGIFQNLLIETSHVPAILDDRRVRAVTLTGSERAGKDVASLAGHSLKKAVLELGGSDPFIVMPSADLDKAVATAVKSRTGNSGQSCIAAKRIIVDKSIAALFQKKFVQEMERLKVGDPFDPATDFGPMARPDLVASLDSQVQATIAAGAKVLTGGAPVPGPGCFYPPTVLAGIPPDSPAYKEELFGPVASLFVVDSIDQAIQLANDTIYGLGASVWTTEPAEQARFISELESGQVFVNAMVVSDPRVPFGGSKSSGYGRELGIQGIREFVQIKTVWAA